MTRITRVGLAGVLVSMGAIAQTSFPQQEEQPERAVARVSVINGEVSVRRGDSGDLVAAALNAPVMSQDRVLTGPISRAEVQLDWAHMMRLGPRTEVRFPEIGWSRYLVQVAEGVTMYRILRDSDAQTEIATPTVSVRPLRRGSYRVEVAPDGSTEITVRDGGRAEIFTPRGSETLNNNQTLQARGTAADPEFQVVRARSEDDWDRWNSNRDRDLSRSTSYRYVPQGVYGVEDLDQHGVWINDPVYGNVWSPRVAAGWAPYRHGRWSWVDYYGWNWVSYDPWGWAPFHYGRWFWGARGWCWWPGSLRARSWWSPGAVAFFGFGGGGFGVNVGIGFGGGWGNVGWLPLAPWEPYHRWYGRGWYGAPGRGFGGRTVVNNTTIINNTNIYNNYRNARIDNAVTAVDASRFGGARVDARSYRSLGRGEMGNVSLVRGQLPVAPSRDSLRLADREVRSDLLPRSDEGRRFYSRSEARPVERVPFEQQRAAVEQESRRLLGDNSGRGSVAGRGGEGRGGIAPRQESPQDSGRGFAGRQMESRPAEPADNGGWRRLGDTPGRSSGEGRRFGEPVQRDAIERGAEPRGGEWRRFGGAIPESGTWNSRGGMGSGSGRGNSDPGAGSGGARWGVEPQQAPRGSQDGWRRFEPRGADAQGRGEIRGSRGGDSAEPFSGGRGAQIERPDPGAGGGRGSFSDFGRGRGSGSGDPVRISPPIVRERFEAPRDSGGRGGFNMPRGDGGSRIERSSPSFGGGGRVSDGGRGSGGRGGSVSAPSGGGRGGNSGGGGGGGRGSMGGGGRGGRGN